MPRLPYPRLKCNKQSWLRTLKSPWVVIWHLSCVEVRGSILEGCKWKTIRLLLLGNWYLHWRCHLDWWWNVYDINARLRDQSFMKTNNVRCEQHKFSNSLRRKYCLREGNRISNHKYWKPQWENSRSESRAESAERWIETQTQALGKKQEWTG